MILPSNGKITDELYAIGVPELPAYLLMGEEPVLFDAGMTFMGPLYLEELKKHLGDANRLRFNFLTHSHFDHCGATPYLKKKIGSLQLGAHRLAADTFKKPSVIELIRSLSVNYEKKYAGRIGLEDVVFATLNVEIVLEDKMEINMGKGLEVRVIATPGHTRDSLSFYIPRYKALITGESVGVFDKNMTIHPEFSSSYRDYDASLEKLASLDLNILMMSHYFVLTGADARDYMTKSIAKTIIFRKRIEDYLDTDNGDREAVVRRIFREDFEDTGAILQLERPYLLNLAAKVKAVAEKK